jgi:hypothetical protein
MVPRMQIRGSNVKEILNFVILFVVTKNAGTVGVVS